MKHLGKGEKFVRDKETNKASKNVREGLLQKQKERRKQELDDAKDVGNYHPTLKKVFESSDEVRSKKRGRGLKMGVGKFRNGILKLSREDIAKAHGAGPDYGHSTTRSKGGSRKRRKP